MTNYLERVNAHPRGSISFIYHDAQAAPMPPSYSDPLELLGDIKVLHLSDEQKDSLRTLLQKDLQSEGAEHIWKHRAFRKNLIYSFGTLV